MAEPGAFRGAEDLPSAIEFASAVTRSDYVRPATWHPGDLAWRCATLAATPDAFNDAQIWRAGGRIVAMAWFYGPEDCRFDVLEGAVPVGAILDWAEGHMRAAGGRLGEALEIDAFDVDHARRAALSGCGFARANTHTVMMRADLASAPQALPDGYAFGDCRAADIDARVESQRAAWSDLAQIGLPEARSKFTRATYDHACATPIYAPALDLFVRDASGAYVANAMCWADAESGEGTFEPVSVVTAHRGKGLARALVGEGMRRFRELGLRRARIFTAHFNAPAIAAYQAAGFQIVARGEGWRRAQVSECADHAVAWRRVSVCKRDPGAEDRVGAGHAARRDEPA